MSTICRRYISCCPFGKIMFERGGKTGESFLLDENAMRLEKKKPKFGSKDLKTRDSSIKPHLWLYTHMKMVMKGTLFVMKNAGKESSYSSSATGAKKKKKKLNNWKSKTPFAFSIPAHPPHPSSPAVILCYG